MARRIPFYYESEIPSDYTEYGCEMGAKFSQANIDNDDVKRIFEATGHLDLESTMLWIQSHSSSLSDTSIVIDTDDGNSLLEFKGRNPKFYIQRRALNTIRHLNTLLNRANETLENGGYLWCHCRTAVLKKKIILDRFPPIVNWLIYLTHYSWHRVCAKLPYIKKIYFGITKGKNRTYNRVEVLGRMYRAGFEVIDEGFRHGEFFVLARKVKAPIWNDEPTGSPLIKLRRVGKDGKLIGVYKFRTMYSYSEYLQPYIFEHNHLDQSGKFANDYRVNIWGKIFRKLWIDELPMITNVLKGEIKLVGVRPLSRHYFSLYPKELQDLRTRCLPGLLPPAVAEKNSIHGLEDVLDSERRYLEKYFKHPVKTDIEYFWKVVSNILFKGRRSK